MDKLHGWLFTYNPHTNNWEATTRDNYSKLFSDRTSDDIIASSSLSSIQDVIIKNDGKLNKVKDFIKNIGVNKKIFCQLK